MKPCIPSVLNELARFLTADIAPALPPSALAGELSLWAVNLTVLAERWDRYVADIVADNLTFESLIERGAAHSVSQSRFLSIAQARCKSLVVSDLEARQNELLTALTEIHAALEEQSGPEVDALNADIWNALAVWAKQRRVSVSQF